MPDAFDSSDRAKLTMAIARPRPPRTYASTASKKKKPDSTSRRSVIHATDSTRSGWIAKNRAPTALATSFLTSSSSTR
jgi:hypothetical protein